MNVMKYGAMALALSCAALLSACGGGGGDPGTPLNGGNNPNPTTATVTQLRMTLDTSTVNNGAMSNVTATVTTLNANSQAVSGATVAYSIQDQSASSTDVSAFIQTATTTTGDNGSSTAEVNLGSDKSNRVVTITATSGGRSISRTINVRGSVISASAETQVDAGASKTIVFTVQDSNNNGIADTPIVIEAAASGLGTRSVKTDSNGSYSYTYTVPNSPGNTIVFNVSAAGTSKQYGVAIKAPSTVLPAPDLSNGVTPALQVNPNVIAVNTLGSSANRQQVVATFENSSGQPIANMRVIFKLAGANAAAVGGEFSSGAITGTSVQYSDGDGKVQTFYVPGTRSSPNNAISIVACYGVDDAAAQACDPARTLTKAITIADEAVSVTIGTDGLLSPEDATLSYAQRFVIKVVNSAGQPKAGLTVSAQINTVNFMKGQFSRTGSEWARTSGAVVVCSKEDLDDDDRIDVGEDLDHDGRLEPIRADVSLTAVDGWVTNADGVVLVKMSYPKNVAGWMNVNIQASSLVGGSEGRASRQQQLAVLVDDVKAEGDPAFRFSPYGTVITNQTLGANTTAPDGTILPSGTVLTPCQNWN